MAEGPSMEKHQTASVIALPRKVSSRKRQDAAFLPAALEIIESPASPAGRAIAITIVGFLGGALIWSMLGQVDIIATAQGRIIPNGKSKVIQPFETGVVREIKVADGEIVRKGDVLVELDPTSDTSDGKRLATAYLQDRLDILRLKALLADQSVLDAPSDIDPAMATLAVHQMDAQRSEIKAKLDSVERQIAQKQAEDREVKALVEKIEASLPLLTEQRDIRGALLGNQYGSRLTYLQTQQQVVEAQHELEAQKQRRSENSEAVAALQHQRAQYAAEFRKNLLADLAKAQILASEHGEELAKSTMHRDLRTLRAPVGGTIQQLAIHTLGGIVTPAEQLMVIVPQNASLEIEATLQNKDIGFVHKGQPVEVKIETFNFTRYGLLHGTVVSLSQDAVSTDDDPDGRRNRRARSGDASEDERQAGQPSYVAHIALDAKGLRTENGFSDLEPGMAVTAEIKTGKRTIINFLLSPLQRLKSESMTER